MSAMTAPSREATRGAAARSASWPRPSGRLGGDDQHYLREGLLPEPVKTSRNMAYYPAEFVERIRLIKQLQEERFMPLRVIRTCSSEDPERAQGADRARGPPARARPRRRAASGSRAAEVRRRYDVPQEVLDRLAELEVLSPAERRLLARPTCASSRRSAASAPAATTSGSASPSTTPCATRRRSRRLVDGGGRGADRSGSPATSTPSGRSR